MRLMGDVTRPCSNRFLSTPKITRFARVSQKQAARSGKYNVKYKKIQVDES